jgi:hypothetical protein
MMNMYYMVINQSEAIPLGSDEKFATVIVDAVTIGNRYNCAFASVSLVAMQPDGTNEIAKLKADRHYLIQFLREVMQELRDLTEDGE